MESILFLTLFDSTKNLLLLYFKNPRKIKKSWGKDSLAVQWLGLCTSTAEGMGLIPGQGTKILSSHKAQPKKKKNPVKIKNCE